VQPNNPLVIRFLIIFTSLSCSKQENHSQAPFLTEVQTQKCIPSKAINYQWDEQNVMKVSCRVLKAKIVSLLGQICRLPTPISISTAH
jgi:hypothetical protein